MAPSRAARDESKLTASSSPHSGPRRTKQKRHHPHNTQESLPGVQKIKSSLRQTRRLLAKENLAADVRVETERRLKALEADLARAETSKKERTYAMKYHKVKFFERQKLVRRIKQVKRDLTSGQETKKEKLEGELEGLRVDLNYVLHYPRTKKYISLFPPEKRQGDAVSTTPDDSDQRITVRALIRDQMQRGEISKQPENELEGGNRPVIYTDHSRRNEGEGSRRKDDHTRSEAHRITEGDDFFGEDGDSDPEASDASEIEVE
ncbi:hypothetical protein DEU56DRAFT_820810 [Suillus clintonianus]|uniref:uncharacterized protein n=1 Tax=Suillus clintonianus TaxID=1904413 RepID=UPI001B881099|nr:uncharacterized protein DEU56DRAFT_820810 [Suillus clintonianus]KAG2127226.1 hypothetical protein DEU56DRAFT_820810 [Suillus clintonianus]